MGSWLLFLSIYFYDAGKVRNNGLDYLAKFWKVVLEEVILGGIYSGYTPDGV